MAYGLKYTQYIEKGGAQVQIKVYEKDWTGASYGMAHVTGLSLQIIGGQSNILSPLLKTSLSFSLVDAYDQGTTQADGTACVNAQSEKCGRWEEFFTPDATKYKVELISTPSPSASASVIWTGFITPDSWSENMIYRGSVTITARDMLGALQDKEFDLTGRVSVRDVIAGALSACECPMALQLTEAHFLVNSDGHSVLDHTFAASTFSGDTWAQALEKTLDSLGLVLRYNGANKVVLTSLRYLAADTTIGAHGIEFINRSGLRQLDPALKSITETFDVDILRIDATDPEATQFTATGSNLTQKIVTRLSSGATQTSTHYIPAYTLAQAGGEGWSGSLAVPQLGTPTDDIAVRKMYIPTDIEESVEATYYNPRLRGAFVFKFTQDGPLACLTGSAGALKLSHYWGGDGVEEIRVRVEAVVGGVRKYLSGSGDWTTSADSFVISVGQEVSVPDSGAVGISIVIVKVKAATHLPAYSAVFAAMNLSVSPASEGTALISEWKTTTNYDQANNVTIKRDPVVGSAGVEGCVDFYGNVLAYGDTIAPDEWRWPGDANNYPLAVMIQAQVLCFHAAAASIFTGTAHDKATPEAAALPGYRIGYYDRVGVPLSGTYDFCSGFIAQTIAREFYTWEEVWGTFDPDYTAISGAGKGSTSATGAGGGAASGGSSGGGGGTSVNYFEPDDDYEDGIKLRDSYDGLRIPGLRFGEGREDFDLEVRNVAAEGETPVYALHSKLPFYSDSFISAGGISPGGGASAGNATLVAQTYGGTLSATGIDPINFYSKEKVDQLLATAGKVQTVAGVSPTDGDIPVASLKSALGLGAAAAYGIGSVASGNTGLVTGGSVYSAINEAVSSVMKMQGTTTTPISDGSTTNPVVIDGSSYTAKKGDVVLYDGKEYLWTGSAWEQLGDEASWALKTTSISAGTGLEGGGTLASNRTISISPTYQTYISHGESAYNSLGDYLPLSGGTLSANNTAILNIDSTHTSGNNWIYFKVSGANKAAVGYYAGLAFISNEATYARIGVNDAGVPQYWDDNLGGSGHSFTIFHSGNSNLSTVDWTANQMTANSFKLAASGSPTLTWDPDTDAWHLSGNFYADGFISAGGISPGGGTSGIDLAAMWGSLTNNPADAYASTKIAAAHIPDMASTYGYLKSADAVADVALNGDYLRVTKNGANTDLTIPYASRAGYVDGTNWRNWDANSPGNYQYLWYYGQDGGVSNFPRTLIGDFGSVVTFLVAGSSQSLQAQLAWGVNHDSANVSNGIAWRTKNNLGWDTTWHRLYDDNYHPTADNASLLNGQPGSYYAPASSLPNYVTLGTEQTITGRKFFTSPSSLVLQLSNNEVNNYTEGIRFNIGGANAWAGFTIGGTQVTGTGLGIWAFLVNNSDFYIGHNGSSDATYGLSWTASGALNLKTSSLTSNGSTIWTAANDGANSGLDADLLDGQHGSYYAAASSLADYVTLASNQTITGVKTFQSIGSGAWSYLRLDNKFAVWDLATVNSTAGMLGVANTFEIRDGGSNYGLAVRYGTSSYGRVVIVSPSGESSLGFWSNEDNPAPGYPIWVCGYTADSNKTFGWYNTNSSSDQGWRMLLGTDGHLAIGGASYTPSYVLNAAGSGNFSASLNVGQDIRAGNGYSIAVGTPGADGSSSSYYANYISAGPGYSANSGRYGVKILVCDQSDAQTGLGQDVVAPTGRDNAYNLCVIGGNSPSGDYGYISFTTHIVNSNSYRYLGGFCDDAGAVTFQVIGNIVATGAITAGSASDARLKTNIQPLSAETAKRIVMALNPVTFTWNSTATKLYDQYKGDDLGFIAQEVEPYLPQAIGTIFEKYMRLDQTKVIAPLVAVAQDHETRIRQLERENSELKRRLNMN